MTVSNVDNLRVRKPRLFSPSLGAIRAVLTGVYVISDEMASILFLDANGSTRTVYLPTITSAAGQQVYISNLSATNGLNIVDADGVAVTTVPANGTGIFLSYRSGWRFLASNTGASAFVDEIQAWTNQTITAATGTIVETDSEIYVNRAGAVTLTLPDCETWFLAHDMLTSYLLVKDVSGAAFTNNITINRAGADTIETATSFVINSDWGYVKLRRVKANVWGIVS